MTDPNLVHSTFTKHFGVGGEIRLFRAPGRVNLIGEHTDYNEGFVLPVAIDRDLVLAARINGRSTFRLFAGDFNEENEFSLEQPFKGKGVQWSNYIEGVARILKAQGATIPGLDIAFHSDVPIGAGLSSSAAMEIAAVLAFLRFANKPFDRKNAALVGQQAEHEYVGTMCGIMDQFVATHAVRDSAILLDCRTLACRTIHIPAAEHQLVICDTGIKHELATTEYNNRRDECQQALQYLLHRDGEAVALRDFDVEILEEERQKMPDVLYRRAKHVITENARTLKAARALELRDFMLLRTLMHESHASLRSDYEVTVPELDALVDHAETLQGESGTRMTGGGFGGCTISFVERNHLETFVASMKANYKSQFQKDLMVYPVEISDAAAEIKL